MPPMRLELINQFTVPVNLHPQTVRPLIPLCALMPRFGKPAGPELPIRGRCWTVVRLAAPAAPAVVGPSDPAKHLDGQIGVLGPQSKASEARLRRRSAIEQARPWTRTDPKLGSYRGDAERLPAP